MAKPSARPAPPPPYVPKLAKVVQASARPAPPPAYVPKLAKVAQPSAWPAPPPAYVPRLAKVAHPSARPAPPPAYVPKLPKVAQPSARPVPLPAYVPKLAKVAQPSARPAPPPAYVPKLAKVAQLSAYPSGSEGMQKRIAPQAPVRSKAIQRWYELAPDQGHFVENEKFPKGKIPLNDLWAEFKPEYQGNEFILKIYNPHLERPKRFDLTEVGGDKNRTNDSTIKDLGCSVFVAADFLRKTGVELLKSFQGNAKLMPLAKTLMKESSSSDAVASFYKELNLTQSEERFEDLSALVRQLRNTPDVEWSGAIAWEGHIVRAEGKGADFKVWDPQGNLANYLLPSRQRLDLFTFSYSDPASM